MQINPVSIEPKTWLEETTYQLLHNLNITTPEEIDLFKICNHLKVDILHTNTKSYTNYNPTPSGYYQIFINYLIPQREQREKIAHELGHILLHSGNQLFMNNDFIKLQERQTKMFTGYLLIPLFMLEDVILPEYKEKSIYYIAKKFNVTLQLASKKYDQLMNRQIEDQYKYLV